MGDVQAIVLIFSTGFVGVAVLYAQVCQVGISGGVWTSSIHSSQSSKMEFISNDCVCSQPELSVAVMLNSAGLFTQTSVPDLLAWPYSPYRSVVVYVSR